MMQGLHKLLLLLLLTCPGQNALRSEIIHGKNASDKSMLYMASVQKNERHICGGFLVSEDFVLSAAHCDKSEPTSVVLGTHNLNSNLIDDVMRYGIAKRCKPPHYKSPKFGNDIMLFKLSRKAQLDNRVQPIKLPRTGNKIKDKAKCSVAGWGRTKTDGKVVDVLQVVEVPFINLAVCKQQWKEHRKFSLPDNVTCAGGYDTDKGFCMGDSGGPLVCGGVAVGVVSFNFKDCDYPNLPNVYTDISKYLHWIEKILKQKNC